MLRRPPRYQEIEDALRGRLLGLRPGDLLPSETQLAEEFSVSRMTARAAVLRLAERSDITFDRAAFADALAVVQQLDDDDFAQYGVAGAQLADLRQRFAQWRARLLGDADPAR